MRWGASGWLWTVLASVALACSDDPAPGAASDAASAPDAAVIAGDAGASADVGVLGPQCAAVAACCPLHSSMFASLAECEAFAARMGEDLCMDRRRAGWCDADAGS